MKLLDIVNEIQVNKRKPFTIEMWSDEDNDDYSGYPEGELTYPDELKGLTFSELLIGGEEKFQTYFHNITQHKDLWDKLNNYLMKYNIHFNTKGGGSHRWIEISNKHFNILTQ